MDPDSQGYQGLVDGGDNIKLAHWHSVTNIIQQVGQDSEVFVHTLLTAEKWNSAT